ncbi:MAG: hypothetical protein ACTSQI_01615 [Candidatus Helarchaeota archaeon]
MRQKRLFPDEERKERKREKEEQILKKAQEQRRLAREVERERERERKSRRQPKNEFYQCECGLILHWRVAYGRRNGCPQCHKRIPLSKLFDEY